MKTRTGVKAGEDPSLSTALELPLDSSTEESPAAQSPRASEPVRSDQPSLSD
ncbi:MAG TPA: hypothetical protein VN256_05845 [Pyrinomonadaceae bacterium]|nr:hypothetical protein [Pyrinomonadaceae bacterium]